jgi:hypothetical protein
MTDAGLTHAIDFGTSMSAIVVCRPNGTLVPVADPGRPFEPPSIPSSVCVRDDGSVLVGSAAENAKNESPGAYRKEFKRDFGKPEQAPLAGVPMTAAEMTVHLLRYLREQAQAMVPGDPERLIITVPVSWEAGNHALMRSAAEQAGYHGTVVDLVPEPVAALAHVFGDRPAPASEFTALVYDLGGGTFDCALARGSGGRFDVLGAPGGIDSLGGSEFDGLLLRLLGDRLGPAVAGLLDGPPGDTGILARRLSLRDDCERIKWELSARTEYEDMVTALTPPAWVLVERAEFEALIRPLLAETVAECGRLLSQLGMTWADVDRVVPVGGSSEIPAVATMLSEACGRAVLRTSAPGLAIVKGAAIVGLAAQRGTPVTGYSKRENMIETSAEDALADNAAEQFIALLQKNRDKLPQQRKPNIIVCGEMGTGKTTTINTLFGEEVGNVGYFSRGTAEDELYEWESHGHNIDVVDLPGMGDTKKHDREYRDMYRRRLEKADGFIVVVSPPRPANLATIRTVNLLISCGVEPERIVFAYNRLGDIVAPIGGKPRRVMLDGIAGPVSPDDSSLIAQARQAFHADICGEVHRGKYAKRFPLGRVVPYDALSGWNLFVMFDAVLESLPGDSLVKWRDAVNRAAQDLQRRTERRIQKQSAEHRRQMEELKKENERLAVRLAKMAEPKKGAGKPPADHTGEKERQDGRERERQEERQKERDRLEAERRALDEQARKLAEEKERLDRERRAASTISSQRDEHLNTVAERFVNWAGPRISAVVNSAKTVGSRIARWWRGG